MRPSFTVVIATLGRETLPRALDSIGRDIAEVIVVADTHSPLPFDVRALARDYGARYVELDAHGHFGGHPQIQRGHELATGDYILNIGDDDEYLPGALDAVQAAIAELDEPRPLLFKAIMKNGSVLWQERELRRSRISGQCIAAPNVPEKLGFWWDDAAFILKTVELHGGPESIVWCDEVIVRCH